MFIIGVCEGGATAHTQLGHPGAMWDPPCSDAQLHTHTGARAHAHRDACVHAHSEGTPFVFTANGLHFLFIQKVLLSYLTRKVLQFPCLQPREFSQIWSSPVDHMRQRRDIEHHADPSIPARRNTQPIIGTYVLPPKLHSLPAHHRRLPDLECLFIYAPSGVISAAGFPENQCDVIRYVTFVTQLPQHEHTVATGR